jgi:hypothetical protein
VCIETIQKAIHVLNEQHQLITKYDTQQNFGKKGKDNLHEYYPLSLARIMMNAYEKKGGKLFLTFLSKPKVVILLVHFMPEYVVDGQLYSIKNSPVHYFGVWVPDFNKCQTIKRRIE